MCNSLLQKGFYFFPTLVTSFPIQQAWVFQAVKIKKKLKLSPRIFVRINDTSKTEVRITVDTIPLKQTTNNLVKRTPTKL